jgi:hypothetical protein
MVGLARFLEQHNPHCHNVLSEEGTLVGLAHGGKDQDP